MRVIRSILAGFVFVLIGFILASFVNVILEENASMQETPSVQEKPVKEENVVIAPIPETTPSETEAPAPEATQPAEYDNALRSAQNYLQVMAMSKGKLYDQLLYEQYTAEQAQYAVDTIEADWNEQALRSARNYQKIMPMPNGQLYDQLIYEQFTPEQAQYALDHL